MQPAHAPLLHPLSLPCLCHASPLLPLPAVAPREYTGLSEASFTERHPAQLPCRSLRLSDISLISIASWPASCCLTRDQAVCNPPWAARLGGHLGRMLGRAAAGAWRALNMSAACPWNASAVRTRETQQRLRVRFYVAGSKPALAPQGPQPWPPCRRPWRSVRTLGQAAEGRELYPGSGTRVATGSAPEASAPQAF